VLALEIMGESMLAEVLPKSGKVLTVIKQQPFWTLLVRKPLRKMKSRYNIKNLNSSIYMEEALLILSLPLPLPLLLLLGPAAQVVVLRVEDQLCLAGGMVLYSPCGFIVTAGFLLLLLLLLLLMLLLLLLLLQYR
jgi:hypothetical protein